MRTNGRFPEAYIHNQCVWYPLTPVFLDTPMWSAHLRWVLVSALNKAWDKPQSVHSCHPAPYHPSFSLSCATLESIITSPPPPPIRPPLSHHPPTLGHSMRVTFSKASSKCQLLNDHSLKLVVQTSSIVSNPCLWVSFFFFYFGPPSVVFCFWKLKLGVTQFKKWNKLFFDLKGISRKSVVDSITEQSGVHLEPSANSSWRVMHQKPHDSVQTSCISHP